MMTSREIAWAAVALRYAKHLDDACPDVGMGASSDMLLDDIVPCGIILTNDERKEIIAAAGG